MTNEDLLNQDVRKAIIKGIKSNENRLRKSEAFKRYEIFKDRIKGYVYQELVSQFGSETAKKMPLISSVNTTKKVIKEEAEVYLRAPERTFTATNKEDVATLALIYKEGRFNARLKKANEIYKLNKGQAVVQPILVDGKIELRVLWAHQFDVIPDAENPEKAFAYITSSFDASEYVESDQVNQPIADPDDRKALAERYYVWTNELNFTMNGKGDIVSDPSKVENDIEMLPFVDVSADKDGEFFVRPGETDTDFTVQYNAALSDFFNIIRLQGYAQAVFTGSPESMPVNVSTGPNVILRIPINSDQPVPTDFKFVSPSPDISGSIQGLTLLLANYLTSRGIDPNVIASTTEGASSYSSGLERLLAMLEKFEASQEDFDLFGAAEQQIFEIVKAWLVKYSNTEFLNKRYNVTAGVQSAELSVQFAAPENVKTESESLADVKTEIDLGIGDRLTAVMKLKGYDEEQATKYLETLDARKEQFGAPKDEPVVQNNFGG